MTTARTRPPAEQAAGADIARFEPTAPAARRRIDFMLQRGAVLLSAQRRAVRIAHSGLTARIDAAGRVRWGG